mgnify:CR=1 FL=1
MVELWLYDDTDQIVCHKTDNRKLCKDGQNENQHQSNIINDQKQCSRFHTCHMCIFPTWKQILIGVSIF